MRTLLVVVMLLLTLISRTAHADDASPSASAPSAASAVESAPVAGASAAAPSSAASATHSQATSSASETSAPKTAAPPKATSEAKAVKVAKYDVTFPASGGGTGIGRHIELQFFGPSVPTDCKDLALFIQDREGLWTDCVPLPDGKFRFTLQRNAKNMEGWRTIIGSPFSAGSTAAYPIAVTVKSATYPNGLDAVPTMVVIDRWSRFAVTFAGAFLLLFGAALFFFVGETTACRDTGIRQMLWFERTYSLGRSQMALWLFLVSAAFVLVYAVAGDWTFNTQSFVLMGISAATGLGAIAIDATKGTDCDKIQKDVEALGLKTQEQVEALSRLVINRPRILTSPFTSAGKALWTPVTAKLLKRDLRLKAEASARAEAERTFLDNAVTDAKAALANAQKALLSAAAEAQKAAESAVEDAKTALVGARNVLAAAPPEARADAASAVEQAEAASKAADAALASAGPKAQAAAETAVKNAEELKEDAEKAVEARIAADKAEADAVEAARTSFVGKTGSELYEMLREVNALWAGPVNTTVFPDVDPQIKSHRELWNQYASLTERLRSKGFISDILTDASGPTIGRFQAVAWTLGIAILYIIATYRDLQAPTLPDNLLTLMGISSGVYLGFKIPEKQPATKTP